jgi:hypothetical protein
MPYNFQGRAPGTLRFSAAMATLAHLPPLFVDAEHSSGQKKCLHPVRLLVLRSCQPITGVREASSATNPVPLTQLAPVWWPPGIGTEVAACPYMLTLACGRRSHDACVVWA